MLICIPVVYAMQRQESIAEEKTLLFFREHAKLFQSSLHRLDDALSAIDDKDSSTVNTARQLLRETRLQYKAIEFFTEYFFGHTANIYNRPATYEIEAAGLEYDDPIGLQVIEDILANSKPAAQKPALLQQSKALTASADDMGSLLYNLHLSDAQILESVRMEILRIGTLGITGYDAPYLKTGIPESQAALASLAQVLTPYLVSVSAGITDSLEQAIRTATGLLAANLDFDTFDRLTFYTKGVTPLQHHLTRLIHQLNLDLNTTGIINYEAATVFSPDFFNKSSFLSSKALPSKAAIDLGKKLFFDKELSANKLRSCATCHQPERYFTDGLKTNTSLSGLAIKRNSPSLYYAVYQHSQFLDGRESSLEAQAEKVITNATEMNGNPHNIIRLIQQKPLYARLFKQAFPDSEQPLSFETIAQAIASYETTLTPFSSAFDAYWAGNQNSLSLQQKAGFNLFTGKAKCATCHFIPLFNGLTPPDYNLTEFETLGMPATANFKRPVLDNDSGRYYTVPLPFTVGSFKIPTVRNTAATAPYMHNGGLPTLEKVMEFYCKGGGEGIGIKMRYQTLSPEKLQLTPAEIKQVVLFLHSLTDRPIGTRQQELGNKQQPIVSKTSVTGKTTSTRTSK